jgi:hypothetical protein
VIRVILAWVFILFLFGATCPASSFADAEESPPIIAEQIVAVVNGKPIFLSDLRRDQTFFEEAAATSTAFVSLRESVQKQIHHQLLLLEAKRFVLEPPSEEAIHQAIQTIEKRFKDNASFQNALSENGMTLEEFRSEASDRLWIARLLLDRITFFIFVTDEEIRQYGERHQSEFEPEGADEKIRAILEKEKEAAKMKAYLARLISAASIRIHIGH